MKPRKLILSGNNLNIDDIHRLVSDRKVRVDIAKKALNNVERARNFLDEEADKKVIYGTNTGFGPMASYIIDTEHLEKLQRNLVLGHATGVGDPIPDKFVLAAMVVRLNTLVKGYSGVSVELVERLKFFINERIIPIIPEHGAVGTSGDLTQLAHIALALVGEGEVVYRGERQPTQKILNLLKLKKYHLKSKEGLSLINGTSVMTGLAAVLVKDAERILSLAVRSGGLSLELIHGLSDGLSPRLHEVRPHHGQNAIAQVLRRILKSSKLLRTRKSLQRSVKVNNSLHKIEDDVQEIYSFRCIPQILGPVLDTLETVRGIVEVEMNSVTDNPVIDVEKREFLHGGNFHGDYIAASVDHLKMALVKLSILSERRINFFLNDKINKKFPPFLNLKRPGYTMGLQGFQFVATSTTAQNQSLAYPHYIHSIPTNADNQDVVSMGTDAALITSKVVDNTYIVLALELVTLSQAADYLELNEFLSESSKKQLKFTRSHFPQLTEDRVAYLELGSLVKALRDATDVYIDWPNNHN